MLNASGLYRRRSAKAPPAIRVTGWLLAILALPAFAALTWAFGKEAGWDFQNYHWYGPYAFLNGRLGFDIAPSHHATYYNPLIDVPLYWLGSRFPSWVAASWLGVQAGMGAALLGGIAYRVLPIENLWLRLMVSVLLAVAGMTGGGALGEIGKTSDDILSGLGILAALLVLTGGFTRVVRARGHDIMGVVVPAGFLAGLSPGLKLTMAPYLLALAVAMFFLPGSFGQRLGRMVGFSIGAVVGIAATGGYWYWTMWEYSGNPVFPYFADLFPSTLVPPGDYSDPTFRPKDWVARLVFPFVFSENSFAVAEWKFRDVHIAIAYVAVLLAALISFVGFRPWQRMIDPLMARMLLLTAAVAYIVWLFLFGIYRYLIPLEMLSPLLIAVAICLLPLPAVMRILLIAVALVGAQAAASPGSEPRLAWGEHYVDVGVPPLPDPANTLIVMTETTPMAYVIPSFPPEIPFLRIQGWLVGSKDRESGLGAEMHERVEKHRGPLYALFWPVERAGTDNALADYGLIIDDAGCAPVRTNIEEALNKGQPLMLCPLTRKTQ